MDGVVAEFDDARGLGVVVDEDGIRHHFHCTQIADGSRTIGVGAAVSFELRPWHLGEWEATAIEPRQPGD